ncbi:MAG: acyl-CoA dehydrogenase family protein [Caulobacter sp.]|nr:acyl-CoA dehydrogenase family protein [Caulobacter sp.]
MSDQELTQIAHTVDAIVTRAAATDLREGGERQVDHTALKLLTEAGLRRVAVTEAAGGSDGELPHLAVVLKRLGYHAVNIALLEDHLAAELLAPHTAVAPEDMLTVSSRSDLIVAQVDGHAVVSGSCWHVPWSRTASLVVAPAKSDAGQVLVALPTAEAAITPHHNVAGEPRDHLTFNAVAPVAEVNDSGSVMKLRSRVLLYRALTMLGAGERALDLTITHVTDRTQFGSPLSRRQVVQHYIAEMFGALTAARAACDAAVSALAGGTGPTTLATSLATRIEADRMASVVARLSHQLHGAIGFTQEHPLHLSTTRLTAWRQDDLSETACALELSRLVPDLGGPWDTLTARRLQM